MLQTNLEHIETEEQLKGFIENNEKAAIFDIKNMKRQNPNRISANFLNYQDNL